MDANGGEEEEEEGRVEKRRATVFELKVERKWRRGWEATRDSSYEEETATVDYRRFENLWTRSSLFPSLPPLSLSSIGYGASGPMLGKSETYTRGLGRYIV